jgi:FkbM family methyltransferase
MKAMFRRLAQSAALQPLWRGLLHLSVRGLRPGMPATQAPAFLDDQRTLLSKLGFGWGGDVETSGEMLALERAASVFGPAPVLFDVGANQGAFTRLFARRFPNARIWCFEPAAATRKLLVANLADLPTAKVMPFGLSAQPGLAQLYSDAEGSGLASVYPRQLDDLPGQAPLKAAETIELRTLDEVCAAEGIDRIDYLKLDIEGHELEALRGAARLMGDRRIRCIQWEYGGCNLDSRALLLDFFRLLTPRYEISLILPGGLAPAPCYDVLLENFHTVNYLAILRGA